MRAMATPTNGLISQLPTPSTAVEEFHNSNGHPLIHNSNPQPTFSQFEPSSVATDDSFEEMLSLPELLQCHWDLTDGPNDDSSLLEAWFPSQQQIIQTMLPISAKLLQQHQLLPPLPVSDSTFKSTSASMPQQSFAGVAAPRRRVRARRGQATDPHSIAERLRRERIAGGMKALQELVPNANKTDKASMLDEIIEYVKFLQTQLKVLSTSRLGEAAAASPLIVDIPSEGRESTAMVMENLVAKLMEEDMGSAIQYLQGRGLCLRPISLVSTATSPSL